MGRWDPPQPFHALALLWATHRANTLLLVALTALAGLLSPLHLWIGRLLIDAVARFLPTAAEPGRGDVGPLLLLVAAQAGASLLWDRLYDCLGWIAAYRQRCRPRGWGWWSECVGVHCAGFRKRK